MRMNKKDNNKDKDKEYLQSVVLDTCDQQKVNDVDVDNASCSLSFSLMRKTMNKIKKNRPRGERNKPIIDLLKSK